MGQNYFRAFGDWLFAVWKSKSRRYWLTAALVLAATISFTPWVNKKLDLDTVRYRLFQATGALNARPLRARYTQVVAITTADYVRGSGGVSPVNRAYLAKIVRALDGDGVQIIALDFILRFPNFRESPARVGDYSEVGNPKEVGELVNAIISAAEHGRKIVLPIDVASSENDPNSLHVLPAIYQAYGLCTKLVADGIWESTGAPGFMLSPKARKNINCGYIELLPDPRQVPPLLDVGQRWQVASLSMVLAADRQPQAIEAVGGNTKFVTYLPANEKIPAGELLNSDDHAIRTLQQFNAVIVGGMFLAHDKQELVDLHDGLTKRISGALIHQNFAEGILDDRLITPLPDWVRLTVEIALGLAFAIVFAVVSEFWEKLLLLIGIAAVLLFAQWLVFLIFASFLEVFLPLLGLSLHSIVEKLLE